MVGTDEWRARERGRGAAPVGTLVAMVFAAALAGCAGKHRNAKNQTAADHCATEQQELAKRIAEERDQTPRVPTDRKWALSSRTTRAAPHTRASSTSST